LEDEHAGVLALLADGESRSSSAIALRSARVTNRAAGALFAGRAGKRAHFRAFSSPALGGAAHDRIHDDIITTGATPHGLGASDEDCRDAVSIHLVLSPRSRGLIGASDIAMM